MNDSLSNIEKKINRKIKELKGKMKKTSQRTKTDRLWVRIEALQLALAQILELRGEGILFREIITGLCCRLRG
jgi:hypothetical protein